MFVYPRSKLDQPAQILNLIGSFWSSMYGGRYQLFTYCEGVGQLTTANHQQLNDTANCLSWETIPVFKQVPWYPLTIRQSQVNQTGHIPRFGEGDVYGGGLAFGREKTSPNYMLPAPGIVDAPWIFNRLTTPSISLGQGIDYTLIDETLTFVGNPFDDPGWPTQPVYDGQTIVDSEIVLWLFNPSFDVERVWKHYGYVLALKMQSSENYKSLVATTLDALVAGPSLPTIFRALSAAAGVPLAAGDETVEAVGYDNDGLLVITDKTAYRYPPLAEPIVVVGQTVEAGDALCDVIRISELNRGAIPDGLDALSIGPGVLASGYIGDLVFENATVPVVIELDAAGLRKVSWEVGGFPGDVEFFWDQVHERGIAAGTLLADLMTSPPPPPIDYTIDRPFFMVGASGLPTTVNPLQFLVSYLLRGGCFIVHVRAEAMPENALGLHALWVMRRILSPHIAMLVVIDLPAFDDSITMDSAGEDLGKYLATDAFDDTLTTSVLWDGPLTGQLIPRTLL